MRFRRVGGDTDVQVTSPAEGDILKFTGGKWKNHAKTSPSYRYYRLHSMVSNGASIIAISSFVAKDGSGTVLPVTAFTASSLYGGSTIGKITAGLPGDPCLMSAGSDLILDMGSPVTIADLDVGHRAIADGASTQTLANFTWQQSTDGISFTTIDNVATTPTYATDGSVNSITVPQNPAVY